ncbi:DUF58 domain-containing protein [Sessilibacter sp. MAH1]
MSTFSLNPRRYFRAQFERLLERNIPAQLSHQLTQRKLFILPTVAGWGYLLSTGLVWLAGTNYENNLALAFSYFLLAIFHVCILHTFKNLHQSEIRFLSATPVFCGESSEVNFLFNPGRVDRYSVQFSWPKGSVVVEDFIKDTEKRITVYIPTEYRGWFKPPRLVIESRHPLGLWRCWSLVDLNVNILTYPKPLASGPMPQAITNKNEGKLHSIHGGEDFNSLREFRQGDSLKHVAWKQYARGQGMLTKNYSAFVDSRLWLDWDLLVGLDRENRLSRLTYLAVDAEKNNADYGLRLPGVELSPDRGQQHLNTVLKHLALFEAEALQNSLKKH